MMESRTRETKGFLVINTKNAITDVTNYFPDQPLTRDNLVVSNGTYQGDHHKPCPIYFRRFRYEHLEGIVRSKSVSYSNYSYYSEDGPRLFNPVIANGSLMWELDWAPLSDAVLAKTFESIKGSANLVVDLAEGGQTLKMIKNVLKFKSFARNFFSEVVKGRSFHRTRGQVRLDYVTSKWLEYRYGWMPLIYSIGDVMDTIAKRRMRPLYVRHRAGRKHKTPDGQNGLPLDGNGTGSYSDPFEYFTGNISYRVEMGLSFDPPDTFAQQLSDWTSLNPLGIAWELQPLSFVADWFVNIGDTLALWENWSLFHNNFRGGYKTTSYAEDVTFFQRGWSQTPFEYSSNGNPKSGFDGSRSQTWHRRLTEKNRVVLTALPTPAAGFRVKANLNAKRMLDACALVQQVMVGGMHRVRNIR